MARSSVPPVLGPVRTCIGCRGRAAKSELLRVVALSSAEGQTVVVPDPGGSATGRGAHLHPTVTCFDLATRRRAFGRALRVPAEIDAESVRVHVASLET